MLRSLVVVVFLVSSTSANPRAWGDALPDYGVADYSCDAELMKPSKTVPTSVHSVRPADIKVVMALGDSITAANGAGAEDPLAIILQYRGLAFLAGGDKGLEGHVTIPNVLRKYNPNLFGYSNGIGSPDVWDVSRLNVAFPGANAKDLPGQARSLVSKLQTHPEVVNMQDDWKLLNIFIGGNDVCGYCRHADYTPAICAQHIQEAVQIIMDNVPRTIVSLTTMLHLELLRWVDNGQVFCDGLHKSECGCESDANFTNAQIAEVCIEYQQDELAIQTSGVFDTKDDFTFVVQPFLNNITSPPLFSNGTVDLSFFSPDCFHFSQYGHAVCGAWLWNNMLEPVGQKTEQGDFNTAPKLKCPDPQCPFIRTTKNSQNCAMYWTEAAEEPTRLNLKDLA